MTAPNPRRRERVLIKFTKATDAGRQKDDLVYVDPASADSLIKQKVAEKVTPAEARKVEAEGPSEQTGPAPVGGVG